MNDNEPISPAPPETRPEGFEGNSGRNAPPVPDATEDIIPLPADYSGGAHAAQ